jgi:hypothetical protein
MSLRQGIGGIAAVGMTATFSAVVAAPAQAAPFLDHWSGTYQYCVDGADCGTLTIEVTGKNNKHFEGHYVSDSGTRGAMGGDVEKNGLRLDGWYKDRAGPVKNKGNMIARLESDVVNFHGNFTICSGPYIPGYGGYIGCGSKKYLWSGTHN